MTFKTYRRVCRRLVLVENSIGCSLELCLDCKWPFYGVAQRSSNPKTIIKMNTCTCMFSPGFTYVPNVPTFGSVRNHTRVNAGLTNGTVRKTKKMKKLGQRFGPYATATTHVFTLAQRMGQNATYQAGPVHRTTAPFDFQYAERPKRHSILEFKPHCDSIHRHQKLKSSHQ